MRGEVLTGRVTGSYTARSGETTWLIDWDDRKRRALVDVECTETFAEGQHVRLVDGYRLESAR